MLNPKRKIRTKRNQRKRKKSHDLNKYGGAFLIPHGIELFFFLKKMNRKSIDNWEAVIMIMTNVLNMRSTMDPQLFARNFEE